LMRVDSGRTAKVWATEEYRELIASLAKAFGS
jgi:hypothetical protein